MNSRPEFRNYRMKLIVSVTRKVIRMPSQYVVDHPTFPVNQRSFHVIVIQVDSNTQALWYTIHFDLAKFHGRVADQHKSISHK